MTAVHALLRHLPDELVVVDVGCRWGFAPYWEALVPHVTLIGFDADEKEVMRLQERHAPHTYMRFVARTLGSHLDTPRSSTPRSRAARPSTDRIARG